MVPDPRLRCRGVRPWSGGPHSMGFGALQRPPGRARVLLLFPARPSRRAGQPEISGRGRPTFASTTHPSTPAPTVRRATGARASGSFRPSHVLVHHHDGGSVAARGIDMRLTKKAYAPAPEGWAGRLHDLPIRVQGMYPSEVNGWARPPSCRSPCSDETARACTRNQFSVSTHGPTVPF